MEKKDYLKLIFGTEYYTIDDLRYNQKLGFMFSKDELAQFFKEKEYFIEENNANYHEFFKQPDVAKNILRSKNTINYTIKIVIKLNIW